MTAQPKNAPSTPASYPDTNEDTDEQEFVEEALASAARARRTGRYPSSVAALKALRQQLALAAGKPTGP